MHTALGTNRTEKSVFSCRTLTSLGSQRHSGLTHVTGGIQASQEGQAGKARRGRCSLKEQLKCTEWCVLGVSRELRVKIKGEVDTPT